MSAGPALAGGHAPAAALGPNKGYITAWDVTIPHGGTEHSTGTAASAAHSADPPYSAAHGAGPPYSTAAGVSSKTHVTSGVGKG